jgi:hypothetical protein
MFYPWDNYKLRTLSGRRKYSEFVVAKAFYTKRYSEPPRVCRGGSFARILLLFASQPNIMGKVLGIVYRTIATYLSRKAGYTKTTSNTGAVTLIQRFGSALNMSFHFHMLFLDGVCVNGSGFAPWLRWVKAPTNEELNQLTHTIAQRIARFLEHQGLLEPDAQNSHLALDMVD